MTQPLLDISGLCVSFTTRHGTVEALRGVTLSVSRGEVLGVVGESGSGKSVTALTAIGLLDRSARVTRGRAMFRGQDMTKASRRVLRSLRGRAVSMIFQNPRAALNPVRRVGQQITDALRAHLDLSATAARDRAVELLAAVQIRDPAERADAYPHELSGGMCQRVLIAMALACGPELLIADEPTTSLDVTTQKTVMDLLVELVRRRDMALLLITHDLGLAARYCERIAVMEAGRVVEENTPDRLFGQPAHPYTRRLVRASPTRHSTIETLSTEETLPPLGTHGAMGHTLLDVRNLVKRFGSGITAVDDVSFTLGPGESVGLVGESGSGKTTISRMICRLLDQTSGTIIFDGKDIGSIRESEFHHSPFRRDIQLVFQDPTDSLNPRFTAFDSIADPLRRLAPSSSNAALRKTVADVARRVGLAAELLDRFPHQLSGGQRARVGIARAIGVNPRLLVLDEPTAALDVSVQAVVLQLLERLRRESGMACLFIGHDLNVVRMMCEQVIVLRNGEVVEVGTSSEIFASPQHEYTKELLAATPHFAPGEFAPRLTGELDPVVEEQRT